MGGIDAFLLSAALILNALEDPFAFALLFSAITLGIGYWHRTHALAFFTSIALTFAAVHIAKSIFTIARPEDAIATAVGYRFPSMHAAIASVTLTGLANIAASYARATWQRYAVYMIAGSLMLFVAWTRLHLGVHRPIDVIVGLAIGITVAVIIDLMLKRYHA